MLTKRQKILIAVLAAALILTLIGLNSLLAGIRHKRQAATEDGAPASHSATAEPNVSDRAYETAAPASHSATAEPNVSDRAYETASAVCEHLAPQALHAYIDDAPGRDERLARHFTPDARGLSIPPSEIAEQPSERFAGFLNTGDDDNAVCSVTTGTEAPWILTYARDDRHGWLCTGVTGGMQGAYRQHEGPAPKAKEER